ncbi:kinase-like domain-containing protein [Lasiosphaeris hirsuta]|uniref:Kinase-like domain-containing protein n=1 Tax=Lasiosphaeris hirsuta TaxID=260670 RepID=A0AA40B0U4_9PEZI|nr:kinase-like domain-containing protein [Lasiosphaeris hirsuta]
MFAKLLSFSTDYNPTDYHRVSFAMEYLDFGDLGHHLHHLRQYGPLSEANCKLVTNQILLAIQAMHTTRISGWWIKVGDFGISRTFFNDLGQKGLLSRAGTCTYLPPEVHGFLDVKDCTLFEQATKADIRSIGITAHKLLTGESCFRADEEADDKLKFRTLSE